MSSMRGHHVRATLAGFVLAGVAATSTGCASTPSPVVKSGPPVATDDPCDARVGHVRSPQWCHLPAEVHRFLDRREICDHFRGEPVPDAVDDPAGERRRQIETALQQSCTGTDAELARLREAYRDRPEVTQALAGLEDRVE